MCGLRLRSSLLNLVRSPSLGGTATLPHLVIWRRGAGFQCQPSVSDSNGKGFSTESPAPFPVAACWAWVSPPWVKSVGDIASDASRVPLGDTVWRPCSGLCPSVCQVHQHCLSRGPLAMLSLCLSCAGGQCP